MSSWKIVQESIKRSMKDLRDLYEAQETERREAKEALLSQFQQKMQDAQTEINKLHADLQSEKELNTELRRQLQALKGDPNRTIQEGIVVPQDIYTSSEEETAPIPVEQKVEAKNETTALRKSLEEAERRAEENRLEEEAKRILEVQKERERDYQARIQAEEDRKRTETLRKQEAEHNRRQQEEEEQRRQAAAQLRQQDEEKNQHILALEKSYSEVCAQLSLAKRDLDQNPQKQELQDHFESQLQKLEQERSDIHSEYTKAKEDIQARHAQEVAGLSKNVSGTGGNDRIAKNEKEIETLQIQKEEIDTKLSAFFVRNKKNLEIQRDEIYEKIDELTTMNRVLSQQGGAGSDSDQGKKLIEKKSEQEKQIQMFDVQWKQRLEEVENGIDKRIESLMVDKNAKKEALNQKFARKVERLEQRKTQLEKQLESLT